MELPVTDPVLEENTQSELSFTEFPEEVSKPLAYNFDEVMGHVDGVDSPMHILMLPWCEDSDLKPQVNLLQAEASRWVKSNMVKVCKLLGVKSKEHEEELLKLLLRIEKSTLDRNIQMIQKPSPKKNCFRELQNLLDFNMKFRDESSSKSRGRYVCSYMQSFTKQKTGKGEEVT
ncbi:hypothetical protein RND71_039900 [Anisodus tanguticus]|uniref:Uncharacterized protein n=1 Tax=Anisodus tanguticus TaxID=243964 RepID=A0AAE1QWM1_9SOLA|nr:hypothetical protein RND71_039900 [Anisodus tanguticus]